MHVRDRIERSALAAAMALPEPIQRRLAGRPVQLDGQQLATDVQLMLRMQHVARVPAVESVPLAKGRTVMRHSAILTSWGQPVGEVIELEVAGLAARLYVAKGAVDGGPLLVFFHGGGFFAGDLESHDGACRFYAERSGVRLLSVDYRLGPEHGFPAAHDDALAAYEWVVENAGDLGTQAHRIGVGGDSAGGNLSAHVAIEAARRGWPCAVQLLVYPTVVQERTSRSAELFGEGFYLTTGFMAAAERHYSGAAPARDPRLWLVLADLPPGLAPALVFTAGFDPLRDGGEQYAERLRAAGVEVTVRRFEDQIHGFLNMVACARTARAANEEIAAAVAASFAA